MKAEGRGKVAPSPVRRELTRHELMSLREFAEHREQFRKYSGSKDPWKNGLIRGQMVEAIGGEIRAGVLPVMVGFVGEYGVIDYVNRCLGTDLSIDTVDRVKGDGGFDMILFGLRVQIKTRKSNYQEALIRCATASGRELPLVCDVYVFCEWTYGFHVDLLGCVGRNDVSQWQRCPAKRGDHTNLVGRDDDLVPMGRLITELTWRREALVK